MSATIIIPARLGSTRFPEKVLANATGWPLIRHVWEQARAARCAARVVIATDSQRVLDACRGFGGECVMTSAEHPNGTARLAEASLILGLGDEAPVVNVQGDEPELDPALIDAAVQSLASSGADAATVASPLTDRGAFMDPNVVKVVVRRDGTALYFSRAPIPLDRDAGAGGPGGAGGAGGATGAPAGALRHVGLYAYSAGFVRRYAGLPPTALEITEKLEQLRVLEHGCRIAVAVRASSHEGIDTPEQYARFVQRWRARQG